MSDVHTGLCIGGPLDGRLIGSNPSELVRRLADGQGPALGYALVELHGERETFLVWAHQGLSADDVLRRTLQAYRKEGD